jgi:hypothetical protein
MILHDGRKKVPLDVRVEVISIVILILTHSLQWLSFFLMSDCIQYSAVVKLYYLFVGRFKVLLACVINW